MTAADCNTAACHWLLTALQVFVPEIEVLDKQAAAARKHQVEQQSQQNGPQQQQHNQP
jgi:hypothetical protein